MAKIHEVAKAAGVSISTVSYALSGKRTISAETRQRIEQAVRELDYRPNAGARMLAGRDAPTSSPLTEPFRADTHAPAHMAFVLATSIAARRFDYDVLLLTEEEATAGMRRVATSGARRRRCSCSTSHPTTNGSTLARRTRMPSVFIGVPDDHDGLVCVDLDFEAAAASPSTASPTRATARSGSSATRRSPTRSSNFPPRVRAGFERRAAELGIAHAVALPDVGAVPHRTRAAQVRSRSARCSTAAPLGSCCTATTPRTSGRARRARPASSTVPGDVVVVSVGATFDTTARSNRPSTHPPGAPGLVRPRGRPRHPVDDGGVARPGVHLIAPESTTRTAPSRRSRPTDPTRVGSAQTEPTDPPAHRRSASTGSNIRSTPSATRDPHHRSTHQGERNEAHQNRAVAAATIAAAALVLSGCSGSGGSGDDDTLRLWHYEGADSAMGIAWDEAIKIFEEETGVTVEFEEKSFEQIRSTASQVLNSDEAPDIIEYNKGNATAGLLSSQGLLTDLDDAVDRARLGRAAQPRACRPPPSTTRTASWARAAGTACRTTASTSRSTTTRTSSPQHGLEVPTTLDEFEDVLHAFVDAGHHAARRGRRPSTRSGSSATSSRSRRPTARSSTTTSSTRARSTSRATSMTYARRDLRRLGREGLHLDGLDRPQGRGHGRRLHQRRRTRSCSPAAGGTAAFSDEINDFEWGTFLFPGHQADAGSAGNMWVVPENAKNKELAYDFIDITMRPEIQALLGNNGGVPVAADPADITDEKNAGADRELQHAHRAGRPRLLPRLAHPGVLRRAGRRPPGADQRHQVARPRC